MKQAIVFFAAIILASVLWSTSAQAQCSGGRCAVRPFSGPVGRSVARTAVRSDRVVRAAQRFVGRRVLAVFRPRWRR
jgi:hypothetical protein